MIHHHPGDDLLLGLAAASLNAGQALVLSVHLEGCGHCRARLHELQAVGGVMLEDVEPMPLAADAWIRTLERIDSDEVVPVTGAARPTPEQTLPEPVAGLQWPRALRGCRAGRWRWAGPGVRFSRVYMPVDPGASLFLLRIAAGRSLPRHSHRDVELTQVLCGSFDDGRSVYAAGDFDDTDHEVLHQPVVQPGGDCVCLAYLGGPLVFEGRVASMVGRLIGM
ncbi:MAG: ChrR family anti-sigma-E factor [Burkholderiaceae bacterium]